MQKMIWIPDDLVEGVKEKAYKEHKSVSQYLIDLHRNKIDSPITAKEIIKGDIDNLPKALMYTEEYRKKNPMESCKVCGKALRINCGH